MVGDGVIELGSPLAERGSETACANCAARSADPSRAGWHVFDDGLGEEHALCRDCTRERDGSGVLDHSPRLAANRCR